MGSENNITTGEYANVIRMMITHEDSLADSRANWLFLVQGLLFTAFSGFESNRYITLVLAVIGVIVTISFLISFRISEKAIANLLSFWDKHLEKTGESWENYPPVIGVDLTSKGALLILDRLISPRKILPWVFVVAWVIICVLNLTVK
jgi:hypothetical protein